MVICCKFKIIYLQVLLCCKLNIDFYIQLSFEFAFKGIYYNLSPA
jgi:hypothetical protein